MRTIALAVAVWLSPAAAVAAAPAEKVVTVDKLPSSIEEFVALRDSLAKTPEGGAAVFVTAMLVYAQDKALGEPLMTIAIDQGQLAKSKTGYKGYEPAAGFKFLLPKLEKDARVARCYAEGVKTESDYVLPAPPYRFRFKTDKRGPPGPGQVKLFGVCAGADTPRPITLKVNDKGLWKAKEASSFFVGVAPAPSKAKDDL